MARIGELRGRGALIDALPPNPNGHSVDDLLRTTADFVADFVVERQNGPLVGDVVDTLLNAEFDGQRLDVDVVIANVVLILAAGVETTGSVVATSLYHLVRDPELRRRLVADPALIEKAREEFLRLYGSGSAPAADRAAGHGARRRAAACGRPRAACVRRRLAQPRRVRVPG